MPIIARVIEESNKMKKKQEKSVNFLSVTSYFSRSVSRLREKEEEKEEEEEEEGEEKVLSEQAHLKATIFF